MTEGTKDVTPTLTSACRTVVGVRARPFGADKQSGFVC